jgi:hypothetical protein
MYCAPPENAKAPRWERRGFAETTENDDRPSSSTASAPKFQVPKLSSAHVDLDTLERMANWRLDLTRRIHRAQLRFELADCELPELHDLAREVRDFRVCCRALMWRPEASA